MKDVYERDRGERENNKKIEEKKREGREGGKREKEKPTAWLLS